jgi:hypothetical protein
MPKSLKLSEYILTVLSSLKAIAPYVPKLKAHGNTFPPLKSVYSPIKLTLPGEKNTLTSSLSP